MELFADWDHSAEATAAHLHSLAADRPGDPDVSALITELLGGSPEFARLWQRHDVRHRRGEATPFRHPPVGEFTLTYEVLYLADGQRMTIYQAEPGSRDHDALTLLSMIASRDKPENAAGSGPASPWRSRYQGHRVLPFPNSPHRSRPSIPMPALGTRETTRPGARRSRLPAGPSSCRRQQLQDNVIEAVRHISG